MIFQYINVCPVPREMLKTSAYGLGFQHLPRDLANVNAWNTMFDPYIVRYLGSDSQLYCVVAVTEQILELCNIIFHVTEVMK